jgi:exodeoxyribonuclease-3
VTELDPTTYRPETRALHSGQTPDPSTHARAVPIYATTSYDDDALVQPQSRDAFAVLIEQGWIDTVRALHPRQTIYTFWDYMRKRWERNAGLRIDHLLVNAALRKRVVAAGVDREVRGRPGASDHAPVWIEIED